MNKADLIALLFVAFLFASPFLIAIAIYLLMAPVTFWQGFATILLILIISGIEGFVAWNNAILIITDDY